jgi:hypothetical protein
MELLALLDLVVALLDLKEIQAQPVLQVLLDLKVLMEQKAIQETKVRLVSLALQDLRGLLALQEQQALHLLWPALLVQLEQQV